MGCIVSRGNEPPFPQRGAARWKKVCTGRCGCAPRGKKKKLWGVPRGFAAEIFHDFLENSISTLVFVDETGSKMVKTAIHHKIENQLFPCSLLEPESF